MGTGVYIDDPLVGEITCSNCDGEKYTMTGYVDGIDEFTVIKRRLKKIMDKLEVDDD
jgi:hypothetical protein